MEGEFQDLPGIREEVRGLFNGEVPRKEDVRVFQEVMRTHTHNTFRERDKDTERDREERMRETSQPHQFRLSHSFSRL